MTVITSTVKRVASNFTRPTNTTQYASGDLVANETTAIDVTPLAMSIGRGGFNIASVRLEKDNSTITSATFRVHFFESTPTVANGDNGVFSINLSNYVGYVDMDTMTAATNGGYAVEETTLHGYASSTYIYALVEARGTYTPTSGETITLTLTVEKF